MRGKKFIALKPFNNKIFYNNEIFNEHSSVGSIYLIAARKFLSKRNIEINTIDIAIDIPTIKDVYMDVPYPWEFKLWIRILKNIKKNILFLGEPPNVNPFNYMKIVHILFSKVSAWNDSIIDNKKYFKHYQPIATERIRIEKVLFKDKKLLTMMNINWLPFFPFQLLSLSAKELYTERIKAIDFFDKFYPKDFYLYGKGWNKPQRFSIKQRIFGCKKYRTYQGEFAQKDKYKILSKFKFCLCFENCEIAGNISEKIFDCFKSNCVPIYWGATNIADFIPQKCFIDFRKFKDYQKLAEFLTKIQEETYNSYIKEINKFLLSKIYLKRWSTESFAKNFLEIVIG